MTDVVAGEVGRTRDDVTDVMIVPEPLPAGGVPVVRGGATPINVRITFTDGSIHDSYLCGGAPSGPACMVDPHLLAVDRFVPGVGYRDLPCTGNTANTCATPLPTIDPVAASAATPLTIEHLDITIDHTGAYAVPIGVVGIPNGVIASASFAFVDDWPEDITIADANVMIDVRSLEPDGKPFEQYYQHGWRPGVERAEAMLVFSVARFDPGAVLSIRDIDVH